MRFLPILLTLFACVTTPRASPATPQNVLVLVMDDVGGDQVDYLTNDPDAIPTPSLDKIRQQSLLLRNFVTSPMCSPSRSRLQTGRYSFRTGIGNIVRENGMALPYSEITLPEYLDMSSNQQVDHAYFGKFHLASSATGGAAAPNSHGWRHYQGYQGNPTDRTPPNEGYYTWPETTNGDTHTNTGYLTSQTVDAFLKWSADRCGPWVSVVAFHSAHTPHHRPDGTYTGDPLETQYPVDGNFEDFYRAMVSNLDHEIGRLLDTMNPDVLQDTTVFIYSDNGTMEAILDHDTFPAGHGKGSPYQGAIRNSCLVYGRGVENPGTESSAVVGDVDMIATIMESLDLNFSAVRPTDRVVDSVSFWPLIEGEEYTPRESIYTASFNTNGQPSLGFQRSFVKWPYSLVQIQGQAGEFFDLSVDPGEFNNLNAPGMDASHSEAFNQMKADLNALLRSEI